MLENVYSWIENLTFYMVIMVAAIQIIPGENYKKYIRFFIGLILILMVISPFMKIMNIEWEGYVGQ